MLRRLLSWLAPTIILLSFFSHAYAMAPGFYFGAALGPATNGASDRDAYTINNPIMCTNPAKCPSQPSLYGITTVLAKPKSTQFGSRVFAGYQFNDYAAVEGGFNYFSNVRYDITPNASCSGTMGNCDPTSSTTVGVRNADLLVKLSFPIKYVNLFAKGGPAYVITNTEGAFFPPVIVPLQNQGQLNPVGAKSVTKYYFKPIFSLGADYALAQNWVFDFTWTHLPVGSNIGAIDFYGIGIAYHFVDKYCGQFLCDD